MPVNIPNQIDITLKKADKYWRSSVVIQSPYVNGEAQAMIILVPYDSDTGEQVGAEKTIVIPNIVSKLVAGDSELIVADSAISAVIEKALNGGYST